MAELLKELALKGTWDGHNSNFESSEDILKDDNTLALESPDDVDAVADQFTNPVFVTMMKRLLTKWDYKLTISDRRKVHVTMEVVDFPVLCNALDGPLRKHFVDVRNRCTWDVDFVAETQREPTRDNSEE